MVNVFDFVAYRGIVYLSIKENGEYGIITCSKYSFKNFYEIFRNLYSHAKSRDALLSSLSLSLRVFDIHVTDANSVELNGGLGRRLRLLKRFKGANVYQDRRGWKYRIMPGLGDNSFKARYHKPDKPDDVSWHCCARMPWRSTFEEAQIDLDALAKEKQWKPVQE